MQQLTLFDPEMERRHAEFDAWVELVRDPAMDRSEGLRTVAIGGKKRPAAAIKYELAELPDGRWATTYDIELNSGELCGCGIPWTAFESREACLERILARARNKFTAPHWCGATAKKTCANMLKRLDEWHAGGEWNEPQPTPPMRWGDE